MSNDAGRSREPQEPEPKPPLAEMIERWSGKPELSGSAKGEFTLNLLNGAVSALWAGTGTDPEILAMRQSAVLQGSLHESQCCVRQTGTECVRPVMPLAAISWF